jgi:hypothetical protein
MSIAGRNIIGRIGRNIYGSAVSPWRVVSDLSTRKSVVAVKGAARQYPYEGDAAL